jgi:hypothetical protein
MTSMRAAIVLTLLLLAGCGTPPPCVQYSGPLADPQVAYRIDDNRYFELVPQQAAACVEGTLTYVDRQQGIRSALFHWTGRDYRTIPNDGFIIDATNTRYLIGPWKRFPYSCQSGGGGCEDRLPYSTDSGRTWQYATPRWSGARATLIGAEVFLIDSKVFGSKADLSKQALTFDDWSSFYPPDHPVPRPREDPSDNHFHCTPNGKE